MKRIIAVLLAVVMAFMGLSLVSAAGAEDDALRRWNALKKYADNIETIKTTEKNTVCMLSSLKKGSKAVFDNAYYTATMLVTSKTSKAITITTTVTGKSGFEGCFYLVESDEDAWTETREIDYLNSGLNYWSFTVGPDTSGCKNLKEKGIISEEDYNRYIDILWNGEIDHCLHLYVDDEKPVLNLSSISITRNSINLGHPYGYASSHSGTWGTIVKYKEQGAKKWTKKTFADPTKKMVLKKLKADTLYEIKLQFFEKRESLYTHKEIKIVGDYASSYKLYTGSATAPEIKSIKISNVKTAKSQSSGYWDYAGNYHSSREDTLTKCTVTVTLKNRPKSMKALRCENAFTGGISKGKGNTFTLNVTLTGNQKGATKKLSFVGISNILKQDGEVYYLGASKAAAVNVTLK